MGWKIPRIGMSTRQAGYVKCCRVRAQAAISCPGTLRFPGNSGITGIVEACFERSFLAMQADYAGQGSGPAAHFFSGAGSRAGSGFA